MGETHYLPYFTRSDGRVQRAVCGEMIHAVDHTAEPTCATCRRWLDADAAEAAQFESVDDQAIALFGEPSTASPVFARDPQFASTAGYVPRKAAR